MSLEERLTLESLHIYAKKYFPDAFAKLAPVGEFQSQKHAWKPTKTQERMTVAPMKLLLGHDKSDPTKSLWAFLCTKNHWITPSGKISDVFGCTNLYWGLNYPLALAVRLGFLIRYIIAGCAMMIE